MLVYVCLSVSLLSPSPPPHPCEYIAVFGGFPQPQRERETVSALRLLLGLTFRFKHEGDKLNQDGDNYEESHRVVSIHALSKQTCK